MLEKFWEMAPCVFCLFILITMYRVYFVRYVLLTLLLVFIRSFAWYILFSKLFLILLGHTINYTIFLVSYFFLKE